MLEKTKEQLIRSLIKEHILVSAVPDFVLAQALEKTTDALKDELLKYIQMYKSSDQATRSNAEKAMNIFLEAIKTDIKESFEQRMIEFTQMI